MLLKAEAQFKVAARRCGSFERFLQNNFFRLRRTRNAIPCFDVLSREHVRGAADKAKGTVKEVAGKVSGDKEMESEGKLDKAKGDLHNAAGNVKNAARDLLEK
jgi:uncharacterized protein YjbJ (UPF0337 family)